MISGVRNLANSLQPHSGIQARGGHERGPQQAVSTERSVVATAQSHTDLALSITTDEGDSVSISFAEDSSATYANLVRGRRGPEGSSRTEIQYSEQTTRATCRSRSRATSVPRR